MGIRARRLLASQKKYLVKELGLVPAEYLGVIETDEYIILERKDTGVRETWSKVTKKKI